MEGGIFLYMLRLFLLLLLLHTTTGLVVVGKPDAILNLVAVKDVQCHACLDPTNMSPGCICEAPKCVVLSPQLNSTQPIGRFCSDELWSYDLLEDGCLTYKNQSWSFCSANMCNAQSMALIREANNCSTNSCPGNSICFDTKQGYKCICPPWDPSCLKKIQTKSCATCGTSCCSYLYCYNGGFCQVNANDATQCSCNCPVGYTGASCEINGPSPTADCCASQPCQNGGACINSMGVCTCRCPPGFMGTNCQISCGLCNCGCQNCANSASCTDYNSCCGPWTSSTATPPSTPAPCTTCYSSTYNPCYGRQCRNGGTMTTINGQCMCVCPNCYSGMSCENYDPCCNVQCQNGGTCTSSNGVCSCSCPPCYTGSLCQFQNPCCGVACLNGGSVTMTNGQCTCTCANCYAGSRCELYNSCCNGGCTSYPPSTPAPCTSCFTSTYYTPTTTYWTNRPPCQGGWCG